MSKTLVFIESKDDIDSLVEFYDLNTLVVSLHPSVSIELEKKSIKYKNSLLQFL